MAKAAPTDIVAGRAGGTVTVIKSSDISTIYTVAKSYCRSVGRVAEKPMMPTRAIAPTNTKESL